MVGQVESTFKNYSLHVDYPWQGNYNCRISVIGDKTGGATANSYSHIICSKLHKTQANFP